MAIECCSKRLLLGDVRMGCNGLSGVQMETLAGREGRGSKSGVTRQRQVGRPQLVSKQVKIPTSWS